MRLNATACMKNLFAILLGATMLGGLSYSKKPVIPEHSAAQWDSLICAKATANFKAVTTPPAMALPLGTAAASGSEYLRIRPVQDTSALSNSVDVDAVLLEAQRARKTRLCFDIRDELAATLSARPARSKVYNGFSVADLRALRDKVAQDAKTLNLSPAKLFLYFSEEENAHNNSARNDALGRRYPSHTVLTLNTSLLRVNDVASLKIIGSHEAAHSATLSHHKERVYSYLAVYGADTTREKEANLKTLAAQRYWEYGSDSIAAVLADDPRDIDGYLASVIIRRRNDNAALLKNATEENRFSRFFTFMNNAEEIAKATSFVDDSLATHPTDINRMRNMLLVRAYHDSKNILDRAYLQSLMPKPPAPLLRRLNPQLK